MSLFPYLCKRGSEVCIQERSMANGRGGVAVEPMPIPCRRVAVLSGAVEGDPEPRLLKGGEKTIKGFDHMYSEQAWYLSWSPQVFMPAYLSVSAEVLLRRWNCRRVVVGWRTIDEHCHFQMIRIVFHCPLMSIAISQRTRVASWNSELRTRNSE